LPFGKNSVMPLVVGSNLLLRSVELGSIDPHSLGQKQALWERPLVAGGRRRSITSDDRTKCRLYRSCHVLTRRRHCELRTRANQDNPLGGSGFGTAKWAQVTLNE
jgi:hypothetical protein